MPAASEDKINELLSADAACKLLHVPNIRLVKATPAGSYYKIRFTA